MSRSTTGAFGLVLLASLTLFSVTGCKEKGPRTLRDERAGIELVVPPSFKVGPLTKKKGTAADKMVLQAGDFTADIGVGVVSEAKVDLANVRTLDAYVEASNKNRATVLEHMEVGAARESKCAGHRCFDAEIRGASNGMNLVYLVRYIETDSYFHQLLAWTQPSRLEENRAVMQGVLDSYADVPH